MQSPDALKLERAAQKVDAGARLLSAWELKGGISAQMHALALQMSDGTTRKLIVRRPRERALLHHADAAAREFRILQFVQRTGMAAPRALLLDSSGEIFAEPYLILDYIEGEPIYAAVGGAGDYAAQMATQLAKLHDLAATADMHFLPRQRERMERLLSQRPAVLDTSLDEGRVRAVLAAVWPLPRPRAEALLHGDFWPGNLLWRNGKLVAVIDWEDAEVGDPTADFAIARLDVLWLFGQDALETFTRTYRSLTRHDLTPLPYWDLFAALRSASRLSEWSATWAELGRPEMTAAKMAADRRWFVQQAFSQISQA
jgi:aminoglycoside phosphotransferase (APT) family kinase protein